MDSMNLMETKESKPDALLAEQEMKVRDLRTRFPNGDANDNFKLFGVTKFNTNPALDLLEASLSRDEIPRSEPRAKWKNKRWKNRRKKINDSAPEKENIVPQTAELDQKEAESNKRKEIWQREEMKKTNPELIAFDTLTHLNLDNNTIDVLGSALHGKDGKAFRNTSHAMTPEILQELLLKTSAMSTRDLFLHLLSPSQNPLQTMTMIAKEVIRLEESRTESSIDAKTRVVLRRRKNNGSKIVDETKKKRSTSEDSSKAAASNGINEDASITDTSPHSTAASCYVHLLILTHLFNQGDKDRAKIAADTLIANLDEAGLRTLDDITAKALDYLAQVYKDHGKLDELKSDFDKRLQTARRSDHLETQGTVICTLADIYAMSREYPPSYEEAPTEVTISAFSDAACIQENDYLQRPPASGIGIHFGPDHPMNTSWPAPCPLKTTDAEALAIYTALAIIEHWPQYSNQPITILTDCKGVIDVLRTEKKRDLGMIFSVFCDRLQRLAKSFPRGVEISIEHVSGHTGNEGNSRADFLARKAIGLDVNMKLKPPKDTESMKIEPAKLYGEKDVEGKKAGFDEQLDWGDQWSRDERQAFEDDMNDDKNDVDEEMELDYGETTACDDGIFEKTMDSIPGTWPIAVGEEDGDEKYQNDAEMEVGDRDFEDVARW